MATFANFAKARSAPNFVTKEPSFDSSNQRKRLASSIEHTIRANFVTE